MPIVEPTGFRVLVTGANGYIAYWIIRHLLEQGYFVRAAIRSLDEGKHLKEYYGSYGDKLELFVVADITKARAYHDAVKSVDAIIHTATASELNLKIISSPLLTAVLVSWKVPGSWSHWNDQAVEFTNAKGKDAPPVIKYSASKVLAEKAAWDFYNKQKSKLQWESVTILPSHVVEPPLQLVNGPETLNISEWLFWEAIANSKSDEELKRTFNYIHVQDIALAHIAALKKEKAAAKGSSYRLARASTWQEARDIVNRFKPELYSKGTLPRGNPSLDTTVSYVCNVDKGKRILGLEYANEEKLIKDALVDFEARGYFEKSVI